MTDAPWIHESLLAQFNSNDSLYKNHLRPSDALAALAARLVERGVPEEWK